MTLSLPNGHRWVVVIGLAAGSILGGCKPSEPSPTPPSTNRPAAEMKREVKEALAATADYLSGTKDQAVTAAGEKLARFDQQLEELGRKTATLKTDAKAEAEASLVELREQRRKTGEKLEELKESAQEKWGEIKEGFRKTMSDLDEAYNRAKSKYDRTP